MAIGLSSCGLFKSEPSFHPLDFVRKDAEAVVELRDISMLVKLRELLANHFGAAISKADIEQVQEELKLGLGFDPTTVEGLKGVGLATKGPVVADVSGDGAEAVWVLPLADIKTFAPVFETVMKSRGGADDVKTETKDGVSVTVFSGEYGPQKLIRAAYATAKGHIIIGTGAEAVDRVVQAVKIPKDGSVRKNDIYAKFDKRLGRTYEIRLIAPAGGAALVKAFETVPSAELASLKPTLEQVEGYGWTVNYDQNAAKMSGFATLKAEGQKQLNGVFAVKGKAPGGVRAVNLPNAVIFVQASGQPNALLDVLVPPNSSGRRNLDEAVLKVKNDLDVDIMGSILPNLSGHVALSVGLGDLTDVGFSQLVGNPLGVMWTAFSASAKDPAKLSQTEAKLEGKLKERNVTMKTRKVKGTEIRDFMPALPDGTTADPLFTTFTHDGAWGFSVEPVVATKVVENGNGVDGLGGKPGFFMEFRLALLSAQLRKFKIRELPPLYRSFVVKALDYLSLFDAVTTKVEPASDGIRVQGELRFSKMAAKTP